MAALRLQNAYVSAAPIAHPRAKVLFMVNEVSALNESGFLRFLRENEVSAGKLARAGIAPRRALNLAGARIDPTEDEERASRARFTRRAA